MTGKTVSANTKEGRSTLWMGENIQERIQKKAKELNSEVIQIFSEHDLIALDQFYDRMKREMQSVNARLYSDEKTEEFVKTIMKSVTTVTKPVVTISEDKYIQITFLTIFINSEDLKHFNELGYNYISIDTIGTFLVVKLFYIQR